MFPFSGLRLLLPALVPSWRFFDAVTASPRVDYALVTGPDDQEADWQEFRPRAVVLSPATMLRRLFWNPVWNENLYLVSLAERLASATDAITEAHSERELLRRVARHLRGQPGGAWLRIRLRFVQRSASGHIDEDIVYVSATHSLSALAGA